MTPNELAAPLAAAGPLSELESDARNNKGCHTGNRGAKIIFKVISSMNYKDLSNFQTKRGSRPRPGSTIFFLPSTRQKLPKKQ